MTFRRGIHEIADGRILAPVLRGELLNPRFKSFDVRVEAYKEREPDSWFHPSTHATWGARKLALYLTKPELVIREDPSYEKIFAVTQGHFFHAMVGEILQRNGIVEELEIYAEDKEHNRRGHMDGRMTDAGVELKTVNNNNLIKKIDGVDALRQYKPGYYAQAQDYLDMHELPAMRFLLMAVFYPYPMQEFVVPRDEPYIAAQRAKYKEAIEMSTDLLPDPCCAPRSVEARGCELRHACPIGRLGGAR